MRFKRPLHKFDYCRGCYLYFRNELLCHTLYNDDRSCPCTNCIIKSMCGNREKNLKVKCKKREDWVFEKSNTYIAKFWNKK